MGTLAGPAGYGLRILLDVVVHTEGLQNSVELLGGPSIGPILRAVAADDGAGACQEGLGVRVLREPDP